MRATRRERSAEGASDGSRQYAQLLLAAAQSAWPFCNSVSRCGRMPLLPGRMSRSPSYAAGNMLYARLQALAPAFRPAELSCPANAPRRCKVAGLVQTS